MSKQRRADSEARALQVEACELDYAILQAARRMSNLDRADYLPELGTALSVALESPDELTRLRCQSLTVSVLAGMALPTSDGDA